MTSQSENDLLTNVGPGTPMGLTIACLGDLIAPSEQRWLNAYALAEAMHSGFAEAAA